MRGVPASAAHSVHVWPDGDLLDTADTSAGFLDGDSDVALLSPAGSPGVSNDVVLLSALGAVSDGGDGVVEAGSASGGGGHDSTGVVHEWGGLGVDGHGHWSLSDGGLEGSSRVGRNLMDVGNLLVSGRGRARSGLGVVRVLGLEHHTGRFGVLHSVFLPSTVAATASGVAVNELLLGEGEELSGLDEVMSLHGADSGEGPAGSTLSLVLHGVDGSLGSPVDGSGGELKDLSGLGGIEGGGSSVSEESLLLFGGHIRELVMSNGGGSVLGVEGHNVLVGLGEVSESGFVFLLGSVGFSVLNNVVDELLLNSGEFGVGGGGGDEGGDDLGSHNRFQLKIIIRITRNDLIEQRFVVMF